MSEDFQTRPGNRTGLRQRIPIYAGVLILVFLLGFVPMWLKARGNAAELEIARRELSLSKLQNTIASAALDARRGDYEPARQAVSNFFIRIQ